MAAKVCANCLLHPYASDRTCQKPHCQKCNKAHHKLLQKDSAIKPRAMNAQMNFSQVFTPTAIAMIKNREGIELPWRCLLDSGADLSFISKKTVETLQLPITKWDREVTGLGGKKPFLQKSTTVNAIGIVEPRHKFQFNAVLLDQVAEASDFKGTRVYQEKLQGLDLADREFESRGEIDIILRIPEMTKLLLGRSIRVSKTLIAMESKLGYLICGQGNPQASGELRALTARVEMSASFDEKMTLFWETEPEELDEDLQCEVRSFQHF